MDRNEMWRRARDWRTPPEEKKRLLQLLHSGAPKVAHGCGRCRKRLK